MNFKPRLSRIAAHVFAAGSVAIAQAQGPLGVGPLPPITPVLSTACNPWKVRALPAELSFGDHLCLSVAQLASPGFFIKTGLMAGLSEWRNNPRMNPRDDDDVAARLTHIYERRAARATGELLAGYFHHEDPRLVSSNEQGFWRRTRATLMSVLTSPGRDGNARVALAPIAGALGSGLTSMALYQQQNSLPYGLERSGFSYSGYFARALLHEFSPDLWSLAPHFVRKHRPTRFLATP